MLRTLTLLLALAAGTPALAQVEILHGYVRATPPGVPNGAAFMVLHNGGDQAVTLQGATAEGVGRIELHQHVADGGMMRMRPVKGGIEVPPGGRVALKPGGYHLMLLGLQGPLQPGMELTLQLHFSDGRQPVLTLPVKPIGYQGPADGDHAGHGPSRHQAPNRSQ